MLPAGFESAVVASDRPQTHVLDRAATGVGLLLYSNFKQKWYGPGW